MKVKLITFHAGRAYKGAIFCECKLSELVRMYQTGSNKGFRYSDNIIFDFLTELEAEDQQYERGKQWYVRAWSCNNTLLAEGWINSTKEALDIAIKLRKLPQKDRGYWQFESKAWKSVKIK